MQANFIIRSNSKKLIIVFSGWSVSPNIYKKISSGETNLLVVHDYRNLNIEGDIFSNYEEINVLGWSLGVWAASYYLSVNKHIKINKSVALNGTNFPIDDEKGIPESIFLRTIETLNEQNLKKFHLRMCGDIRAYRDFAELNLSQDINNLKEELLFVRDMQKSKQKNTFSWQKAYIGKLDNIFPAKNQENSWCQKTKKIFLEIPHYDLTILKNIINDL